jgi:hypothetical protein
MGVRVMAKARYVCCPRKPFLLFSMGLGGYGGECNLWNVPEEEIGVYHILVRIRHEMTLVRRRTGENFYLFGTYKPFMSPREKLIKNLGRGPIDILFTVNLSDLADLEGLEEPRPENLKQTSRGWRTMIDLDTGQRKPIPKEIRLWGGDRDAAKRYYGLSLAGFEYLSPEEEHYLRGKHLFHYLNESPVKSRCQFSLGTLYVDPARRHRAVRDRRILAIGKLNYPYVYEIKP